MAVAEKQYLVTGAAGQVGSELVRAFADEESSLSVLGRHRENFDVSDRQLVLTQIGSLRPAAVIHAACFSDWWRAEQDRLTAYRTIVEGTDNVVKACAYHGVPVIVLSCHTVFGSHTAAFGRALAETDPLAPCNHFSTCKVLAEHAIFRLGQTMCPEIWNDGFRYWVLRLGALFSGQEHYNRLNLASPLLQAIQNRRTRPVPLEADNRLSPLYLPHLVQVLRFLLEHPQQIQCGVYHVANAGHCSHYEFGRQLAHRLPQSVHIQPTDRAELSRQHGTGPAEFRPGFTALATDKFARTTGFTLPPWQAAVEEFAAQYARPALV